MTSWKIPGEAKTFGDAMAEADVSNRVEVLSIHTSADDDTVSVMYRKGTGQEISTAMFGTEEFISRFTLVTRAMVKGSSAQYIAEDNSQNDEYSDGWSRGDNGGYGFGAWRQLKGTGLPVLSIAPESDGDKGFSIVANSAGERAVVRDIAVENAPMENGEFQVTAWHGSAADFQGFAIYDALDNELFRWGVGDKKPAGDQPGSGFVYSLDGGASYELISGEVESYFVDYSLAWEQAENGGLLLTLSGWDSFHNPGRYDYGTPWEWVLRIPVVVNADSVAAVGAIVTSSSGSKREMVFDYMEVYPGTASVPEPGTGALLALGVALLFRRLRRKRNA